MNIKAVALDKTINILSGLGNNNDSIIPMTVKDTISNAAIVNTYRKEGGKDDARERAIEEFGTGVVWLFGIPAIKTLIDKTIYPFLKLNPNVDVRTFADKDKINEALKATADVAFNQEKQIFSTLGDKNSVLKSFTNEQLYKGLFTGKFITSTLLSAIALSKLIKYKQKTTDERIKRDYLKNNASKILINNKIKHEQLFCGSLTSEKPDKQSKEIAFKGLSAFMYNPIANTSILDGVITGTRLKEARKGERKEVALKEGFQIVFIYALAKPIQIMFEKMGSFLKMPIGLDPKVLFDSNIKDKIASAAKAVSDIQANKKVDIVEQLRSLAPSHPLIEILDKDSVISTLKDKEGTIKGISHLKHISSADKESIEHSFNSIKELNNNIANIKSIKAFKVLAILGNIALGAWAMGVAQPKVNIWMRKLLNNGDNRNPAIVAQEKEMHNKIQLA